MPERFKYPPSTLGKEDFVALYGGAYDNAPQFAAMLWPVTDGCINSPDALARALQAMVDYAGRDAQLALIRAYPGLTEQLCTDGQTCTAEELADLRERDDHYRTKFGFPFIPAMPGSGRAEVLAEFDQRLDNDPQTEFATALAEIHRRARQRLFAIAEEE